MLPELLHVFEPGAVSHCRQKRGSGGGAGREADTRGIRGAAVERVGPFTFVVHESPAELLEGSPVAHGPQRAVELVVGHHQVLRVAGHVDHLEETHSGGLLGHTTNFVRRIESIKI